MRKNTQTERTWTAAIYTDERLPGTPLKSGLSHAEAIAFAEDYAETVDPMCTRIVAVGCFADQLTV